ncbi:MAG TPA: class I SAM-dependent methyltransferase [Gaiellaceae bacterium]|nr:class I SAM-dependent methyltransferase [Gaiellaceae bacterium]
MGEWEWNPDTYLAEMAAEIPGYEELQEAVVAATADVHATRVLELGTGTGESALRMQALHPHARWLGIDSSEAMLARARERLPDADLRLQRLEDELPPGPFDLVVSALAVHHLDGAGKRELFSRVADVLRPGGRFVLGDVVVPPAGQQGPIYIDRVMDLPDSVDDQLAWLRDAGLEAEASSVRVDLAVFRARLSDR